MIVNDSQFRRGRQVVPGANLFSVYVPGSGSARPSMRGYVNLSGFGRIRVRRSMRGFGGYGGFGWDGNQQKSWCAQNYPSASDNAACMDNSGLVKGLFAPWTDAGRIARGLPGAVAHAAGDVTSLVTGGPSTPSGGGDSGGGAHAAGGGSSASSAKIFGIPKKAALIGGGILALGVLAYGYKKMRRGGRR